MLASQIHDTPQRTWVCQTGARKDPVRDCVGVRRRAQRGSGKLDKRRPQNVAFRRRRLYVEWGQPGFPSRFPAAGSMPRPEEAGEAVSEKTHARDEYLAP